MDTDTTNTTSSKLNVNLPSFGDEVFQAECIQKKRYRRGKVEYLVKWKGYSTKQSTWEPTDNILDPLLIAEFDSKREEWRKKQRIQRKKRKQRMASVEHLSDEAIESDQDDVMAYRPNKRRGQNEENLWPYLPSDRLPLLWGTPPRAQRPRKARQKSIEEAQKQKKMEEQENERNSYLSNNESSVICEEKNKKRKMNNLIASDIEEGDESVGEKEEEEEDEEEEKWSTECWEVKYSPPFNSSRGEPNVLRVHRVRSDVDYVERELSPLSDNLTTAKKHIIDSDKNNKIKYSNNNGKIADNDNSNHSDHTNPANLQGTNLQHRHLQGSFNNNDKHNDEYGSNFDGNDNNEKTNTLTSELQYPMLSPVAPSTTVSSIKNTPCDSQQSKFSQHSDDQHSINTKLPDTHIDDDWNLSCKFENLVREERERMESQLLKESLDEQLSIIITEDVEGEGNCSNTKSTAIPMELMTPPTPNTLSPSATTLSASPLSSPLLSSPSSSSNLGRHPRSYSYSGSDQYHHKKLHHAKRRHTMDAQRITVTDVQCHQVKVTFLESESDQGFFKQIQSSRTV